MAVAMPVMLMAILMPLTFSIAAGIAIGFLAYVLIHVLAGRTKQHQCQHLRHHRLWMSLWQRPLSDKAVISDGGNQDGHRLNRRDHSIAVTIVGGGYFHWRGTYFIGSTNHLARSHFQSRQRPAQTRRCFK